MIQNVTNTTIQKIQTHFKNQTLPLKQTFKKKEK